MIRRAFPALAFLLFAGQTPAAAEPRASIAIVQGLAEGDMLNLRATASPFGKVETRLPNGAALKKFGCNMVEGYEWCEVVDLENASLRGWVPARYLQDDGPADDTAGEAAAAPAADAAGSPQPSSTGDAGPGVPSNLAARFGDVQQAPASPADEKSVAAVRKAMQEAYGNATGNEGSIPAEGVAQNPETDGTEATGSAAATVPLPTPRPDGTGKDIARVDPAAPSTQGAAPISGDIPCARYIGQPMTRCSASVTRNGDGSAAVTVTWPDGGTRTINFRDRKPAGSDSTGEFRFTREGTLNMIRIGPSERFEIVDALPFGG